MKLKRLIVQGFKSFKDRTVIHFDDGITGIVGPNGCGKSNIVDALFWVMGEQSAKHLRGNSMKDVIFAGSSKYSPGAFAEATLVLENVHGKHIHIGNRVASPSEIQLTRKLYRNGDTEYRINNEPARLRDIQEVFMDTGAGAKSYSIIAQGEINRLVQAKPEERRTMIEEVAGITKFKMRKRESLKKIEATQSNLSRLNDLQAEIEKQLKALEKQAEKAERAKTLKEKIRRNELVSTSHKVFDLLKNLRDGATMFNEKRLEVESWNLEKEQLEVSLADERLNKDEQTDRIEEFQKEYNDLSRNLAGAEERLNSLCREQSEKEKQLEQRQKDLEDATLEVANRQERLEKLLSEREEVEAQGREEHDFEAIEERVQVLKEELELRNDTLSTLEEEVVAARKSLVEVDQQVFKNNSRLEEFSAQLQDLAAEIEALEKQYSGVSTQIADEREAVNDSADLMQSLTAQDQNHRAELEALTHEVRELEKTHTTKNRELIQAESKLSSLIEINKSLEGVKAGAANFLDGRDDEAFSLLGNLIRSEEDTAAGVQILLADIVNTLIARDENGAKDLVSWLEGKDDISLDFLQGEVTKTSSETEERLRLQGLNDLRSLNDVVQIAEGYEGRVRPLLNGLYLSTQLTPTLATELSSGINFRGIAANNGTVAVKNHSGAKLVSFAGAGEEENGVVARNNRIEALTKDVETYTQELTSLTQVLDGKRETLENLKVTADDIREQLSDARADHASKKSALEGKLAGMESGTSRLEILKKRKTETSKARVDLLESDDKLTRSQIELKEQLEEKETQYSALSEEASMLRDQYDSERQELLEKQAMAKGFNDRMASFASQIEDIEGQIVRLEQRVQATTEAIEKLNEQISDTENELQSLEASNQEAASVLQNKEEALSMLKDQLVILLQSMQEREDEVKGLSKKIVANEKDMAMHESKLGQWLTEEEQYVRDAFEKYRVDLRKTIGQFLEYNEDQYNELNDLSTMFVMETENGPVTLEAEEYVFNRRYGQDLRDCEQKYKNYKAEYSRLGDINWQAIEDYERQKLRHDFLRVQEQELRKSLEDLETAIAHIDEKSKLRFKAAFEEVDTRFQKVFPIIFGGGNARLQVVGNLDDSECGVDIIAQPPGKKMQNINLMSGGEKAMTAVSLIFSIFLVKPSPFCLLDEVDAPLDDANVGRFNELLREMSQESQFILITHNKKTMELNDTLYGVTMQEPGVSNAVSVQLH